MIAQIGEFAATLSLLLFTGVSLEANVITVNGIDNVFWGSIVNASAIVFDDGSVSYGDSSLSANGPWGVGLGGTAITLPPGSTVSGATITFSDVNSFVSSSDPAFAVSGSSTLEGGSISVGCPFDTNLAETDFTAPFTSDRTYSLALCSGTDFSFNELFNGEASLFGTIVSPPTDPGIYFYQGYLNNEVDFSISVDFTPPGSTVPEPRQAGPFALTGAFLIAASWRRRARKN